MLIHEHTLQRSDLRVYILGIIKDIDVSVTNPLRQSYVSKTAAGTPPSAADRYAAEEKTPIYVPLCEKAETTFVPCSMDCYGNWGKEGIKFVRELAAARAALSSGLGAHVYERRIIQQCSVALMISNARAIAKGRSFHAAEARPCMADDASDGESDDDEDYERLDTAALEWEQRDNVEAPAHDIDDGTRYEGAIDVSTLGAGVLAKLASGANPRIPPMRALAELAKRTDDLGGEPRSPRARVQWISEAQRLDHLTHTVLNAWRLQVDDVNDDSDAEAGEDGGGVTHDTPVPSTESAEHQNRRGSDGDPDAISAKAEAQMLLFLEEMEQVQHEP